MKRFLFGLMLVTPFLSLAQSNFQQGYVVTNSKDTLMGYVNYKERTINPSVFNFKTQSGDMIKYTVNNCSAYAIDNMDSFERYAVGISQSRVSPSELSSGPDTTQLTDTVFLKVLQRGENLTLFSYTDKIKERFYILEKGQSKPYELIRQLYFRRDQPSTIVTDDKYQRQLLLVMRKFKNETAEEEKKLARLNYKAHELKKLVAYLNGQEIEKSKYKKVRYFAGAGISLTQAKYSGDNALAYPDVKSKTSYMPYVTVGADVFVNPAIRRLVFRTELTFLMSKNENSAHVAEPESFVKHTFDQKSLIFTPQIIYHVYNADNIKAFLGMGVGFSFSSYSNNLHITDINYGAVKAHYERKDYVELEKFNFVFPVTAGVTLNKRIEIVGGYQFRSSITRYVYYSISMERYRIGVNYLFGKH
ncbi:hypothetical protein ACSBL2_03175 [Pedobacter sp. AW31-3R]|uniref:hypothetical protein n=1 Tax=Pedobacter sp. AW31-3R TaxID=3445781 RepID=UPI003FA0CB16